MITKIIIRAIRNTFEFYTFVASSRIMERKIIQTADGSSSLFIPELDEHYHSVHGAVQESTHVFIEAGLKYLTKQKINVFEMGYGTGLNFLLTFLNSGEIEVDYHGIEAYPLEQSLVEQLNYSKVLQLDKKGQKAFDEFHNTKSTIEITESFEVFKYNCKLVDFKPACNYDLIYFDAFSPEVQPELWEENVFQKMFDMLNPEGVLTTYCAKGKVRRAMQSCGFDVERLPGPPGKREILRATRPK